MHVSTYVVVSGTESLHRTVEIFEGLYSILEILNPKVTQYWGSQ